LEHQAAMLSGTEPRINCFACHVMPIAPFMSPHGAIILDDYDDYGGCRRATDELLTSHQQFQVSRQSGHVVLRRH
jgi:hypothetical protein